MKNRHNKRAWWHDYCSRSIYMITINKRPEAPVFSHLVGDWRIPLDNPGCPDVWHTDIGKAIRRWIKKIPSIIPNCQPCLLLHGSLLVGISIDVPMGSY